MEEDTRVVVDGSAAPCSISQRQRKLMNKSLVAEELKRIIEFAPAAPPPEAPGGSYFVCFFAGFIFLSDMFVALFDDVERLGGSCRSGGLWRRMVSRRDLLPCGGGGAWLSVGRPSLQILWFGVKFRVREGPVQLSPVHDRRGESFRVTVIAAACFACNNRLSSCGNGSDLPPCCCIVEALSSCFWFSVVAQGGLFGSHLGHWSEVFPWETCVRIGLPSTSVIRLDHFDGPIFGLLCRKDERH
ncbi:hypothetical protein DY000_02008497 [Brassica cretica]|uniref:BHLH domain-containing protein n=2 Tax=Brassica cretica TaxID=69181 RepID=A0ABQ7CKH8_BRACR|nr:hypothetical protein DY000_02008497 [Brassica cretica]